jgi:hypothetical protein
MTLLYHKAFRPIELVVGELEHKKCKIRVSLGETETVDRDNGESRE